MVLRIVDIDENDAYYSHRKQLIFSKVTEMSGIRDSIYRDGFISGRITLNRDGVNMPFHFASVKVQEFEEEGEEDE